MFDKSLTTNFLPLGAMMQPRSAELVSSILLSVINSAQSALSASIPALIAASLILGRGRFCGWNVRPAQRPVRAAPANCNVPRSRPSLLVERASAWYLLVLVVLACSRLLRRSLTALGNSG